MVVVVIGVVIAIDLVIKLYTNKKMPGKTVCSMGGNFDCFRMKLHKCILVRRGSSQSASSHSLVTGQFSIMK